MPQESLSLPYLVLLGVVALTIIVSFVIYLPQLKQWQSTRVQITTIKTRLAERQQFLQTIDQKSVQLQANAVPEKELSVLLPLDESFANVLRIIDRESAAAAVFVKSVDNTTAATQSARRVAQALGAANDLPEALTAHGVNLTVEGSYQQIRLFISRLENAIRFMDLSSIALSAAADKGGLLTGSLTANFYSLQPPK